MDDDLAFLIPDAFDSDTGTVIVLLPDNSVSHIYNVNPSIIKEQCPLLYHAFELGAYNFSQANIEATSRAAVVSLLRFLYTGSYITTAGSDTLLHHAVTFKIAQDFDVPALQVAAYANFNNKTELSSCYATPPADLSETIRFLYEHLASHQARLEHTLVDTLLHYCLSIFAYQQLGHSESFRQAVYDIPAFYKDLCRLSMERNFQDDGASELLQLPAPKTIPEFKLDECNHIIHDFWQDPEDDNAMLIDDVEPTNANDNNHFAALVHRPKNSTDMAFLPDSPSSAEEDYGFTLVHRPKSHGHGFDDTTGAVYESDMSTMTSPELLAAPSDLDADGDTDTEDSWSLV
ncbi:unnamed protein product [Periconia digitata]|uniref:BTB domain-containing protein n=1 Tax=Periconia digitata TaxID=1303443 RepID=A0A9W4XQN7_9PLEO|nr:unnamed protein product [Periconia digitata]